MIIRALQCSSINPAHTVNPSDLPNMSLDMIIWLPDDMGNINTRQTSKRFDQKYVPVKWFLTITDLLENFSVSLKALFNPCCYQCRYQVALSKFRQSQ